MMIDPILNTAPVCQGIRLASLSFGWLRADLFDPELGLTLIDRYGSGGGCWVLVLFRPHALSRPHYGVAAPGPRRLPRSSISSASAIASSQQWPAPTNQYVRGEWQSRSSHSVPGKAGAPVRPGARQRDANDRRSGRARGLCQLCPACRRRRPMATYRDCGNDRRHEDPQGTEANGHKAFMPLLNGAAP
jgi:hypothetical protein